MKRLGIYILVFILLTAFLFIPTRNAYACTCPPEDENTRVYVQSSLNFAEIVFSGRVIKLEKIGYSDLLEQPEVKATFEVYKVWKGPLYQNYIVHTGACDYPFFYGQEYLIFAYGNVTDLYAGTSCSPSVVLRDADRYIQFLDEGQSPQFDNPYITQNDLIQDYKDYNAKMILFSIGIPSVAMMIGIVLIVRLVQRRKK